MNADTLSVSRLQCVIFRRLHNRPASQTPSNPVLCLVSTQLLHASCLLFLDAGTRLSSLHATSSWQSGAAACFVLMPSTPASSNWSSIKGLRWGAYDITSYRMPPGGHRARCLGLRRTNFCLHYLGMSSRVRYHHGGDGMPSLALNQGALNLSS